MKKLVIFLGKSCAGKGTLEEKVIELSKKDNEGIELSRVISYTTAPIRKDQVQGYSHYFISKEKEEAIIKSNKICAETYFVNEHGAKGYHYFVTENELQCKSIYEIDPQGLSDFIEKNHNYNLLLIYITAPRIVRWFRALRRGNLDQYKKRVRQERAQFKEFETSDLMDIEVNNVGFLKYRSKKLYAQIKNFMNS